MGILDSVAKTVLQVRVEGTTEAKAQLRSLGDAERKIAEDRVKGLEAGNAGLEKWIGVLGQVGVAIGVAKVAFDAFNDYAHKLDLESAAAGVSIDGLAKAAHGLKTNMELLEHAAVLNKSAFHLTQEQMETAETAMRSLESRGRSSSEVWGAMETALTKGTIAPLERLGIIIDKTGLSVDENGLKLDTYGQKQQALERIMKGLAGTAKEVQDEHMNAADAMNQTIVTLKNYWDEAKMKLGEMVTQLKPLIDGLAQAVSQVSKLASLIPKDMMGGGLATFQAGDSSLLGGVPGWFGDLLGNSGSGSKADWGARRTAFNQAIAGGVATGKASVDVYGNTLGGSKLDEVAFLNAMNGLKGAIDRNTVKQGSGKIDLTDYYANLNRKRPTYNTSLGTAVNVGEGGIEQFDLSGLADQQQQAFIEEQTRKLRYEQYQKSGRATAQNETLLAKTFGPIEQFSAYAKAFDMLTGAVSTGLNAWIDGSVSAGKAIQMFIATALKGLASQMAVEALKHGAYALGSLAFGDVAGASTHAAAAAAFGAGAIAAAIAAKEMGGSANVPAKATGASGGGAGAGASGGSGGGNGKSGGNVYYIAYGDAFAEDSPRNRRLRAEQVVKKALGGAAGSDS